MLKETDSWNHFVSLCLNSCFEKNGDDNPKIFYILEYYFDEINLSIVEKKDDLDEIVFGSISISIEEYSTGNLSDEQLVEKTFFLLDKKR